MAQDDYAIANASGATVRGDINNQLAAIVSLNSGASAPSTTFAYMLWYDTTANALKERNAANTAWLTLITFDQTGGLLRWDFDKGADIASATTTDIGAATGNYVVITGTTTITGLGTIKAGVQRLVRFSGALTLTHNATSLILPGGADIATAAGDMMLAVSEGSGNWRVPFFHRQTAGPFSELETEQTTTSGTSKTFTGIPANTKRIKVMLDGVSTNGTSRPILQIGPSGGLETSGYRGSGGYITNSAESAVLNSSGFVLSSNHAATHILSGHVVLEYMGGDTWTLSGNLGGEDVARCYVPGGIKTLAGTLTQIGLTTEGGTDTFDAGSWNIRVERD